MGSLQSRGGKSVSTSPSSSAMWRQYALTLSLQGSSRKRSWEEERNSSLWIMICDAEFGKCPRRCSLAVYQIDKIFFLLLFLKRDLNIWEYNEANRCCPGFLSPYELDFLPSPSSFHWTSPSGSLHSLTDAEIN